jgi:hypothetical protein
MPPNPSHSDPQLVTAFRRFAAVAAVLTALVGAGVLAGWVFGFDPLALLLPGGQLAMRPLTALGLLLGGVALWLLLPAAAGARPPAGAWQRRLGLICAGATAVLGGLILLEYLLGVNLGLDQVLALRQPTIAVGVAVPFGRPGPGTAGILLLVGLALLALDDGLARLLPRWLPSAALATVALVLAGLALLDYFYEATTIGQVAATLPIEPSSALAGALLALGVLAARPEGPLVGNLTTTQAGGSVTRPLLPAAILLPFV